MKGARMFLKGVLGLLSSIKKMTTALDSFVGGLEETVSKFKALQEQFTDE